MKIQGVFKCTKVINAVPVGKDEDMRMILDESGKMVYRFAFTGGVHTREYRYDIVDDKCYVFENPLSPTPCNVFEYVNDEIISKNGDTVMFFTNITKIKG